MIAKSTPFFLLLTVLISGCGSWGDSEDETPIVVTFKDEALRQGEIQSHVPEGLSEEDSVFYADFYIEQWIREQAIADVATNRIENLEQRVEYKVRDYRRKLIVHEYTDYLIENKLDTTVSETELREYYMRERNNYLAKEDLYSYFFVVSPSEEYREIRDWLKSDEQWALDSAKAWCQKEGNAETVKLDSNYANAFTLNELEKGYHGNLRKVKIGQLIRWTGVIAGKRKRYYFKLNSIVEAGEPMPFHLVSGEMRAILLNDRRFDIIHREEDRILNDAKAKKLISRN